MSNELMTADDLFGEFQHDSQFLTEQRRLASRTNLAVNVNRLRRAKGWTQAVLAREAGMKQPRIAEIERGDANPRLDTITRVASALRVNSEELLAEPDHARAAPEQAAFRATVAEKEEDTFQWSLSVRRRPFGAANENFALAG